VGRHWRYISSFHGPWLQLPPEVLDSLAYSNYVAPRPHPIDPAVFFDLVKVRRLVEEATTLAVRAANGTTSSSLGAHSNGGGGILGGGGNVLGLGLGGGGPTAKLSKERKHRMRELATQKLSEAYNLDEIAASVATMQSASTLEDVAKLVLQRNPKDSDAKYVHFFHEKIPSRMLAQSTSLTPLTEVIQDRPADGAPLRTRAVTRVFKDDFTGAAKDLTEALAVCRCTAAQHNAGQGQLALANTSRQAERPHGSTSSHQYEAKVDEEHKPASLEPQLLFHRANVYLTLACQHIHAALNGYDPAKEHDMNSFDALHPQETAETEAARLRAGARKLVKTYAKRSLRDYLTFLSNFDYSPGLPYAFTEDFFWKVNAAANGKTRPRAVPSNRLLEMSGNSNLSNGALSDPGVERATNDHGPSCDDSIAAQSRSHYSLPAPEVYQVSSLFLSTPPANLPPYPVTSQELVPVHKNSSAKTFHTDAARHEAVTYHPLLTDALHSLLLCHSLIQTSPKEHLRHAHMVARLARVCDGYPIFLAARSPSRADWIEVIRRANNWIGLQQSWETLCAPAPLPGHSKSVKKETEQEMKERCRQEAIMEALADERVHDGASFQAAVAARERLAEDQRNEELGHDSAGPKRWAQSDGKEYPISTERADAVSRWVRDAPRGVDGGKKPKRNGKKKGVGYTEGRETPEALDERIVILEDSVEQLNMEA